MNSLLSLILATVFCFIATYLVYLPEEEITWYIEASFTASVITATWYYITALVILLEGE